LAQGSDPMAGCEVRIWGLAQLTTEAELRRVGGKYGKVVTVRLAEKGGEGFVTYADSETAHAAAAGLNKETFTAMVVAEPDAARRAAAAAAVGRQGLLGAAAQETASKPEPKPRGPPQQGLRRHTVCGYFTAQNPSRCRNGDKCPFFHPGVHDPPAATSGAEYHKNAYASAYASAYAPPQHTASSGSYGWGADSTPYATPWRYPAPSGAWYPGVHAADPAAPADVPTAPATEVEPERWAPEPAPPDGATFADAASKVPGFRSMQAQAERHGAASAAASTVAESARKNAAKHLGTRAPSRSLERPRKRPRSRSRSRSSNERMESLPVVKVDAEGGEELSVDRSKERIRSLQRAEDERDSAAKECTEDPWSRLRSGREQERDAKERAAREEARRQKAELEANERAARDKARRQKYAQEAKERAEREEAERQQAKEHAEREAERQKAEQEAKEHAEWEAERQKAEQQAKEHAEREAERQQAEQEAKEHAEWEEAERQQAEQEAKEHAEREEAERQQAEQEATERAAVRLLPTLQYLEELPVEEAAPEWRGDDCAPQAEAGVLLSPDTPAADVVALALERIGKPPKAGEKIVETLEVNWFETAGAMQDIPAETWREYKVPDRLRYVLQDLLKDLPHR